MTDQQPERRLPWPVGTMPTAAQLLEWLRDPNTSDRHAMQLLAAVVNDSATAHRCRVMDHDHAMRELTTAQLDAARWRILRDHVLEHHDPTPNTLARKVLELMGEDHREDTP